MIEHVDHIAAVSFIAHFVHDIAVYFLALLKVNILVAFLQSKILFQELFLLLDLEIKLSELHVFLHGFFLFFETSAFIVFLICMCALKSIRLLICNITGDRRQNRFARGLRSIVMILLLGLS